MGDVKSVDSDLPFVRTTARRLSRYDWASVEKSVEVETSTV